MRELAEVQPHCQSLERTASHATAEAGALRQQVMSWGFWQPLAGNTGHTGVLTARGDNLRAAQLASRQCRYPCVSSLWFSRSAPPRLAMSCSACSWFCATRASGSWSGPTQRCAASCRLHCGGQQR